MLGIYAVALLSLLLDALVAHRVLRRGAGRIDSTRLLRSLWVTALFATAKACLLLLVLPGRSFFLLVLLTWLLLVVSLPLVALLTLRTARHRSVSASVRAAAWLALALPLLGLWGSFVEPFALTVERVRVALPAARGARAPLRLGVLADLQARAVGAHERRAVDELMGLAPDLILIPGDVAQVWPRDPADARAEFHELLARLEAPLGVYCVIGNTDDPTFLADLLQGTRVRLLRNEIVRLEHDGLAITLGGLDMGFRSTAAGRVLAELERAPGERDLRLLLAHYPDTLLELARDSRVDLLVAGHTHGGQVQLPGLGPPITLSGVPRHMAAGGLSELDGRRVYISRGVGCERGWAPRLRLLCRPEISLLTLEPGP